MKVCIAAKRLGHKRDGFDSLARGAIRRYREVFWCVMDEVYKEDDTVYAEVCCLSDPDYRVNEDTTLPRSGCIKTSLSGFDVIILKRDVPLQEKALEKLSVIEDDVLIINRPSALIANMSKSFLLQFSDFMPETIFSKDPEEILDFIDRHKKVVIKKDFSSSGEGVMKVWKKDKLYNVSSLESDRSIKDLKSLIEDFTDNFSQGVLVARFLEGVKKGDKRLIVIGDQIIGSVLRMPSEDNSWICNLSSGGQEVKTKPASEEKEMVKRIAPSLNSQGLYLLGFDTLVGDDGKRVLSEINIKDVGAFENVEDLEGLGITDRFYDWIERFLDV